MIIRIEEIRTLIEYGFENYFKPYSIILSEVTLDIKDNIHIKGIMLYKGKKIVIDLKLEVSYQDNKLIIYRKSGDVIYNGFRLPYMKMLHHINKSENIEIKRDRILCSYALPIKDITVKNSCLEIQLKDAHKVK